MQQHSPSEIKEKLLQALDRDYHVVDMALALEAVSLLEKTAVTKEALETTRLGKLVNEMRKKTKNDSLARRAKDLVRRWRDMVAKPSENGTGGTGQGHGQVSLGNHLRAAGVKSSASSPALIDFGRLSSPALTSRPGLAVSPSSPAFCGVSLSPGLRKSVHPAHVISPSHSVASNTSTSPGLSFSLSQTHSNSSRPSTPSSLVAKSKAISPGPGRPVTETLSRSAVKSNIIQRGLKRTRDDEETMTGFEHKRSRGTNGVDWPWTDECSRDSNLSWSGDSIRLNQSSMPPQGSGEDRSVSSCSKTGRRSVTKKTDAKPDSADVLKEKFASIARVSKVKTTQELLEDIARRTGSPTILPVQPAAAAARSSAAVESATSAVTNAAVKTERHWPTDAKHELMAKFFQSHSSAVASTNNHSTNKLTVNDPVAEILARLPPLDPSIALQWHQQQQVDEEEVVQDDTPPEIPRPPAKEEDVDRLHSDHVDNVNGSRDWNNEFHEWHETLSVSSYQQDLLHLLPYVVID